MSPALDITENTIRVRQKDPDRYEKFRVKEVADGIKFVFGKVKGKDDWEVQSIIFDKSKFDKEKVKKWIKEHGFKIMSSELVRKMVYEAKRAEEEEKRNLWGWYIPNEVNKR
jgi:hypothetical protein